jgi:hypothetical protein
MAPTPNQILIEGLTPDQVLDLPDDDIAALIAVGPIVFRMGSASILGQVKVLPDRLVVELAQVDGGGEGVLPTLWMLADRLASKRQLGAIEWIVHAVNCAHPNLKLRRLLIRQGFEVVEISDIGSVYRYLHRVGDSIRGKKVAGNWTRDLRHPTVR